MYCSSNCLIFVSCLCRNIFCLKIWALGKGDTGITLTFSTNEKVAKRPDKPLNMYKYLQPIGFRKSERKRIFARYFILLLFLSRAFCLLHPFRFVESGSRDLK